MILPRFFQSARFGLPSVSPQSFPRKIPAGMRAAWTFQHADVRDVSPYGNDGGGPALGSTTDGSITLNGTSQYVNCGDVGDFGGTVTISMWAYLDTLASTKTFWSVLQDQATDRPMLISALTDGTLVLTTDDGVSGVISSTGAVGTGTWCHITSVINNGGTSYIYQDGVQVASGSLNNSVYKATEPFLMGVRRDRFNNYNNHLDGRIGETRAYARALGLTEIQSIYNDTRHDYP